MLLLSYLLLDSRERDENESQKNRQNLFHQERERENGDVEWVSEPPKTHTCLSNEKKVFAEGMVERKGGKKDGKRVKEGKSGCAVRLSCHSSCCTLNKAVMSMLLKLAISRLSSGLGKGLANTRNHIFFG